MSETGETWVLVSTLGERSPDPRIPAAAELGAAALALTAAAAFARYRNRHGSGAAPRLRRIALAAAAFALAFLARDSAYWTAAGFAWTRTPGDLAARAAVFGLGAILLFAFADWVLARLDPRRNRGWLAAAPLIFAILVLVPLRLTWVPDELWLASFAGFALNGAAGGLVWWSLLPPGEGQLARLFD